MKLIKILLLLIFSSLLTFAQQKDAVYFEKLDKAFEVYGSVFKILTNPGPPPQYRDPTLSEVIRTKLGLSNDYMYDEWGRQYQLEATGSAPPNKEYRVYLNPGSAANNYIYWNSVQSDMKIDSTSRSN